MTNLEPMLHMDSDYNWRWYTIDDYGRPVAMSARSFFTCEDAKGNYELACLLMQPAV